MALLLGRNALPTGFASRPLHEASPLPWLVNFALKAVCISAKTLCQSHRLLWRNRRIEGYHGLSLRSNSQRQSGTNRNATHTGIPNAPAKWATDVSQVIIRSRFAMT